MSLFATADLHLSFDPQSKKSMEIFKGFENHIERLTENWNKTVGVNDTVVIAGDTSWAMTLQAALSDFIFIYEKLNGKKIIIKGNHDYWWTTISKMNGFLEQNNLKNIIFLNNNSFLVNNKAVCGTRGSESNHGEKLQNREVLRLEASIIYAKENFGENFSEISAFLHYPPIYGDFEDYNIIDVMRRHGIKRCFYGHLHGDSQRRAFVGTRYGIDFSLISADFTDFKPVRIL